MNIPCGRAMSIAWWMISRLTGFLTFRFRSGIYLYVCRPTRVEGDARCKTPFTWRVRFFIYFSPWSSDCVRLCTRLRGPRHYMACSLTHLSVCRLGLFFFPTRPHSLSALSSSWCLLRTCVLSMEFLAVIFISFPPYLFLFFYKN